MYFNFSSSDIAISSTNLARKISAKASRNFASAYKFFYMLCKTMVFWALFPQKKRRKPFVYGHSPLHKYKDNTFSAEIQIALTYRNTLRNVKRRVLHTRGFARCYITRPSFGRCAPLASSEALWPPVSFGDGVPWFHRSLWLLVG